MRSVRLWRLPISASLIRWQSSRGGGAGRGGGGGGRFPSRDPQRFGGSRDGPPSHGPPQSFTRGAPRNTLSEPQLVARLLELYPSEKSWLPVNRWAPSIPEDIQEALVPYGGLAQFATTQTNFFIVRKENGTTVISLSTMASSLCKDRAKNIKKREERANSGLQRRREDTRRQK